MKIVQALLVLLIRLYQLTVSPVLVAAFGPTGCCRFKPSCSQYALEVIRTHGAIKGGFLAARRLCRCHPWGNFGEDLPPRAESLKAGHCHGS
jgi:putative membrane protein insertion efficiency factor